MVRALLPALRADARAEVTLAASGAAFDVLAAAGDAPRRFALPDGATHVPAGSDYELLLREVRALLSRVEPDVIVVGISSLGVGLDEGLLACAGNLPTFALQDYPGDANAIDGKLAGLYFVRDEAAARLTRARHDVAALPIGSLRHAGYASLDLRALRSQTRARLAAGDRAVVGFFGQPAKIPGQEQAFRDLVSALARRSPPALVLLREHPKSPELRTEHLAALAAAGLAAVDATGVDPIEPWLAACDIVATCFSQCAMDYAFLDAASPEPLGATLFLLTTHEARAFFRDCSGEAAPDGVAQGLGQVAETAADVSRLLGSLLAPEARRRYHDASQRLPRHADIPRIVETLLDRTPARSVTG
jgi:hypothetical protein